MEANHMGLTAVERETHINLRGTGEMAHIYTNQPPMMRKLREHPLARRLVTHRDNDGNVTGREYEIPRRCIRIVPGKERHLSQEQREAARRRMKRIRAMKR